MLLTIALFVLALILFYVFLTWNYSYWMKLRVPGPEPKLIVGCYPNLFRQKRHLCEDIDEIYKKYKNEYDFIGVFSGRTPQLLILSPELIRKVLVNDFKYFHDNEASLLSDKKRDPILSMNPFVLTGEEWKEVRTEILPGLTPARIKAVYPITNNVCKQMCEYIDGQIRIGPKDGTDAKDLCLRYTSEIVTDCVLGLKANSFTDNPSPIVSNITKLFQQSFVLIFYMALTTFIPWIRKIYKLQFVPKSIADFFVDLMNQATKLRKTQLEENDKSVMGRIDFLNYMLELQKRKGYTTETLTGHIMTFLIDGYETTAGVLAHTLYVLGRYPEKQEKLLKEIKEHLEKNSEIDFDKLQEMPYLDACIHECIRLYAPGLFSFKLCTEPIELTNKNGQKLQVAKGTVALLPYYSIMHDEDYYEDPFEFVPERFLEEPESLKKYREQGLYYGFGDGPRICLGMRFALTQMKAALVKVVLNYIIKVNPRTRKGFCLDAKFFMSQVLGGIWLDFEKRQ